MSKYEKLWKYIKKIKPCKLSFLEIEKIIGLPMDHSFLTYKKELEDYGFKIGKISMKEKIVNIVKI